ncbi:terpenoid synthase [Amanita muscaria]
MRQCSLNFSRAARPALYKHRAYTILAHKIENPPQRLESLPINLSQARPGPFALVSSELNQIRDRLLNLVGSAHPSLDDTAKYFLLRPAVQLRSLLVLLFSRATNGFGQDWQRKTWEADCERTAGLTTVIDDALQNPDVLHDWHRTMSDTTVSFSTVFDLQHPFAQEQGFRTTPSFPPASSRTEPTILPSQIRLGQMMEMVHIASLLHDVVYDGHKPGTNVIGNKLTILGGDFLLGRVSAVLPRLGENEVVELVSGIISNIVEGEMLRMEGIKTPRLGVLNGPKSASDAWEQYLKKIYLKSASLMAKGTRASVVLGGCQDGDILKEVAYAYGRNIGFAKQLMDDARDYEFGSSNVQSGLAAAPALYAMEEHSELFPIISRHMSRDGDVECVIDCVRSSSSVERTRDLARTYGNEAKEVLHLLPDSDATSALETLIEDILAGSC